MNELDDGDDDDENDDEIDDGGEFIIEFNDSHSELLSRLVDEYCGQGDVDKFEIAITGELFVMVAEEEEEAVAATAAAAAASAAALAELTTGVM